MARQLRVDPEGGWYHVGSRGTERRDSLRDDRDRMHWLGLLHEAREMFGLVLHTCVSMNNHFHLEVELKGESWEDFRDRHGDWGRDLAMYLGRKECGMRLNELGSAVGKVDYAAVSLALKRFERGIEREQGLVRQVRKGKHVLNVET